MVLFSQLKLLLWKNLLLQRRKVVVTILEVLSPLLFAYLIVFIGNQVKPQEHPMPTVYESTSYVGGLLDVLMDNITEVGFAPDTPLTRQIMDNVLEELVNYTTEEYYDGNPASSFTLHGFNTEEELVDYHTMDTNHISMGVTFPELTTATTLPTSLSYYMRPRTPKAKKWFTGNTFPFSTQGIPRQDEMPYYRGEGVLMMQVFVAQSLMKIWSKSGTNTLFINSTTFDLTMQRMPFPPYTADLMIGIVQSQLPLFLVLSFILSVMQTVQSVVYEKEQKLKESMKLMGLIPAAHWASWFLTCFAYLALAMALFVVVFNYGGSRPVLVHADSSLFYVFLLCYAVAIITFCFMISATVQRANIGAAVGGVVFFATYCLNFYLKDKYQTMTYMYKLAASLLFNQAMAFGANVIGRFEGTGDGIQWSNVHQPATVDDNYSLMDSMLMMLFDSLLHLLVTWYLDNVWPGDFGVPKPVYFCFTPSYWGRSSHDTARRKSSIFISDHTFEREPTGLKAGIRICELSKVFGNKAAVNHLSLNMYEGQITVLLGHNGAGKTTTMSMLTGFIPPTSGTAFINDLCIRTHLKTIRQTLGLCPQHDILFGSLSVEEHLTFFAKLKGCPKHEVKSEVDQMIVEVGLAEKRKKAAKTLSGGQKRKLSVGIALIAGSKVIMLDEPTAGMDPAARRQIWEVLQRHRAGRTMLLTTHFMDEADLLGDRIAIMAQGVVKCSGTPMFLKKLYGTGYHMIIVKNKTCNVPELTQLIQELIPTATLESDIDAELSYLLPDKMSHIFPQLFDQLHDDKDELGIINFGASATTLEEVFMKFAESAKEEQQVEGSQVRSQGSQAHSSHQDINASRTRSSSRELSGTRSSSRKSISSAKSQYDTSVDITNSRLDTSNNHVSDPPSAAVDRTQSTLSTATPKVPRAESLNRGCYTKLSGWSLHWSRIYGLVIKKAIHSWRNRAMSLAQLALPVVFTLLALGADKAGRRSTVVEPSLDFNLGPFGPTTVAYSSGYNSSADSELTAQLYSGQFKGHVTTVKLDEHKRNMTQFFIDTVKDMGTGAFNKRVIIGAEFDSSEFGTLKAVSWFNGEPYHAQPVALAYTLNALARKYVNSNVDMRSGVYPLGESTESEESMGAAFGFIISFCISIGMAFLTNSFIHFLVKERITGAKHLQVVSGVSPLEFWCGNLLWDFVNYLLPCFVLLLVFWAYGTEAYVKDSRLGLVFLLLAMHGLAILPFVYLVHFFFSTPATAMVIGILFSIFSGLITMVSVFILGMIPKAQELCKTLNLWFLSLFPNYGMTKGLMDMYANYAINLQCTQMNYTVNCHHEQGPCCRDYGLGCPKVGRCLHFSDRYLSWSEPGIGKNLLALLLQGLVFFTATLVVDFGLFAGLTDCFACRFRAKRRGDVTSEDDDVAAEKARVNESLSSSQRDPLLLANLYKQYGNFVAVDRICIGVPEKECFGLLGQNGAGKTTTFKMLTGDVHVTHGNAYLMGYDVNHHLKKVQANMGYCPQFDALIDQMTGIETLTLYGRLRGVPASHLKACVDKLIDDLTLRPHANGLTRTYSGGNKRKLSTAIALIGDPPFILLDEPSTGMDPASKRYLWNVLDDVRASGRTLVLTSHSMEECEALCTRIAIMVNGRFVCLGSSQHLKSKFGQGYTLEAKMDTEPDTGDPAPIDPFVSFIQETFPSAHVFDAHQGYAHIQVPDRHVRLSDVFRTMERAKRKLQVQAYHVHQTTLEQVFLSFTRQQESPEDMEKDKGKGKGKGKGKNKS